MSEDRILACGTLAFGTVERPLEWNGTSFVDVGHPDQLMVPYYDLCAEDGAGCVVWPLPKDWRNRLILGEM